MELRKKLTLSDLVMIGVGNIIGSGIFILFAYILSRAKQHIFWAFLLAAIPNILCALAYAELTSIYQQNDTEYNAIKDTLGYHTAKITIYFLLFFIIFNASTILLFAGHLIDAKHAKIILCLLLIFLSYINYLGISLSKMITNTVGIVEIIALLLIPLLCIPYLKVSNISTLPPMTNNSFLFASFMSLFLYSGYDTIVKLTEESIDSKHDVPIAIIISVLLATLIYLLLGLAASSSNNMQDIYNSNTPITQIFRQFISKDYSISITILGIIIIVNTLFISLISLSRFMYSLSQEGILPSYLQEINKDFHTPHNAIITVFLIMTAIILLLSGEKCAMFTNIFFLLFSICLMASVIILRIYKPDIERPFRVPFNIQNIPIPMCFGIIIAMSYLCIGIYNYQETK